MKEIFFIKDTLTNKISYYHMLAFLIALPFDRFYSEVILISLLLHMLIHLTKQKIKSARISMLFPVLLYLLTMICTIYSINRGQAFKEWEKQLAIVLFPCIFSVAGMDFEKYKWPLLKAFGITCILLILYLFFDAIRIIDYNKLPVKALFSVSFTNHNFSAPFDLHATYFSMYITICMAAFLNMWINSKKNVQRIFYAIGSIILFAGLLQLSSRAAFIAALVIINIVFPFFLLRGTARGKFILISLAFSIAGVFSLAKMESFKTRFITGLKQDLAMEDIHNPTVSESRLTRWRGAWILIKESPVYGYGTGSEIDVLKRKYSEQHLYTAYLFELNAHNQYLSFMLKSGFFGIVLYLYLLFLGYRSAIRERNFMFCSFLVIITIVSFSENILDVNKGIFFFSFFFALFINISPNFQALFPGKSGSRKGSERVGTEGFFNTIS